MRRVGSICPSPAPLNRAPKQRFLQNELNTPAPWERCRPGGRRRCRVTKHQIPQNELISRAKDRAQGAVRMRIRPNELIRSVTKRRGRGAMRCEFCQNELNAAAAPRRGVLPAAHGALSQSHVQHFILGSAPNRAFRQNELNKTAIEPQKPPCSVKPKRPRFRHPSLETSVLIAHRK